eukprot:10931393-Alexandrium_andersonii.AAC.1
MHKPVSLHREMSTVQTAICQRPASAAIRLDSQSALRNMQDCFKCSELELRGPRNGLNISCPKFPRGALCAV